MFVGFREEDAHFTWPVGTASSPLTVADAIIGDLPVLDSDERSASYIGDPVTDYQRLMRGSQAQLMNHQAPRHPPETIERIGRTAPGAPMYENYKQRIRLHPDKPSPTVISGGIRPQFAYGHPTQPRGLTIRERARLMSFPDSYEFLGGLTQGRVQTGDAVPPLLAQAVADEIRRALRLKKSAATDLDRVHVRNLDKALDPQATLF